MLITGETQRNGTRSRNNNQSDSRNRSRHEDVEMQSPGRLSLANRRTDHASPPNRSPSPVKLYPFLNPINRRQSYDQCDA